MKTRSPQQNVKVNRSTTANAKANEIQNRKTGENKMDRNLSVSDCVVYRRRFLACVSN